MREIIHFFTILVDKFERNRLHRRFRCRWNYNIQANFKEIGCALIDVAYDVDRWWTIVNTVISIRILCKAGNI